MGHLTKSPHCKVSKGGLLYAMMGKTLTLPAWLRSHFPIFILGQLLFGLPGYLVAQGSIEALSFPRPGLPGYLPQSGGIGWSFVPTANLLVTSIASTAPEVRFWQGTNQTIGTYAYAGPFQGNAPITNFQVIPAFLLSAGQTYSVSAENPNFSSTATVVFYAFTRNPGDVPTFDTSPYISQFASYYVSPDGQWSPGVNPASENVNYLYLGPNFQFQVVPEPSTGGLLALGAGLSLLHKRLRI